MDSGRRVLVIDGLRETEEVLKAVLEPKGHCVNRIRAHEAASHPSDPNVVVVHSENGNSVPANSAEFLRVPHVVIGSRSGFKCGDYYLQKPFQYPELIGAIERLLANSDS